MLFQIVSMNVVLLCILFVPVFSSSVKITSQKDTALPKNYLTSNQNRLLKQRYSDQAPIRRSQKTPHLGIDISNELRDDNACSKSAQCVHLVNGTQLMGHTSNGTTVNRTQSLVNGTQCLGLQLKYSSTAFSLIPNVTNAQQAQVRTC